MAIEVTAAHAQSAELPPVARALSDLSPDELMRIEVTSVSKKPETRWRTPAAIAVITRDEIRRSGVTSVVEALRLAPGIQVARIDANKWAVGIRGFGDGLTRSVLVLIDGRSVYSPLSAGTFWEVQDVLLADVERIEVIRGPGGSLWGANAVNGVVNVITRSSRETRGLYATGGAGDIENAHVGVRYGGVSGERLSYRVYAKAFDRAPGFHRSGTPFDAWWMGQAGFRADWDDGGTDTVELHGDAYHGESGHRATVSSLTPPLTTTLDGDTRLRGGNLTAKWRRVAASGVEWGLRGYYDRTFRRETTFGEARDTVDFEAQRRSTHGRHDLTLGGGYRISSGKVDSVPLFQIIPARRTDHLWSAFVRDEVSFREGRILLALGSKVEHNGYSGVEIQPTVQGLWAPNPAHSFWAAAARAVRTPARLEHDLVITSYAPSAGVFVRLQRDPGFVPEKVFTLEAGYRARIGSRIAVYGVGFHNTHRDLFGFATGTPEVEVTPPPLRVVVPILIGNRVQGSSHGAEVTMQADPREWWHVGASYSWLRLELDAVPGLDDLTHEGTSANAPRHSFLLTSRFDAGRRVDVDVMLRRVGALAAGQVPAYTGLDARLAWRPGARVEIAAVGRNLLRPHHLEFLNSGSPTVEARRGFFGSITWGR